MQRDFLSTLILRCASYFLVEAERDPDAEPGGIWIRRKDGKLAVRRRMIAKPMRVKLREVKEELVRQRHIPAPEQGRWLGAVVRGYFSYHIVPDNIRGMNVLRGLVSRFLPKALRRRSRRRKYLSWERMACLIETWIAPAELHHPYPDQRLRVSCPR